MRPHWIASLLLTLLVSCASAQPRRASPREDLFSLISWNLQTFGTVPTTRQRVCRQAYESIISTSVHVIAFQEVANARGLDTFGNLLPGNPEEWWASFQDTPDSQDNGIAYRVARATITAEGFLFQDPNTEEPDDRLAKHPIRWAHIRVGDFDFTLLSVHLTFRGGDAAAAAEELVNILDWLADYFKDPKNDPDVIIAGDFNLPSRRGKSLSYRGNEPGWIPLEDIIEQHGRFASGPNRLTVLVDEPTSRPRKVPANNYDHFIVSQDVFEEFVSARRVPIELIDQADATTRVRVSDHYPIEAWFKSHGGGVRLDAR